MSETLESLAAEVKSLQADMHVLQRNQNSRRGPEGARGVAGKDGRDGVDGKDGEAITREHATAIIRESVKDEAFIKEIVNQVFTEIRNRMRVQLVKT